MLFFGSIDNVIVFIDSIRMPKRRYITTAIDYPNAAPHMGHVLEKLVADMLARYFRMKGDDVRFQIGTDEHGIKIQQKAAEQGVSPAELVDANVPLFTSLYMQLGISADVFIRTSDRPVDWKNVRSYNHRQTVEAIWNKLCDAGVLEKRTYTGLYCTGCERFVTKRDLVDGLCPDHNKAPEEVSEENWFLAMSKYGPKLEALLTKNWDGEEYRIVPNFRSSETLSLIEQGLEDVSFSRPASSLSWGIPVPNDEGQTMYVWCDALTNYLSGIGYFTDSEEGEWWNDATVTHVIGKDIARFHALIWPLMLKASGVRTPDELLIHGFLTSEGKKMSKSLGNVVVPQEVIDRYGVDALRFYLAHEIPVGNDGDFSWKRFGELYDAKLRNALGNLLNRVLVMLGKEGGVLDRSAFSGSDLQERTETLHADVDAAMQRYEVHMAMHAIMAFVDELNERMSNDAPWKMEMGEKVAYLTVMAEALRHVAMLLLPFVPGTSETMLQQLGASAEMSWGGDTDWSAVAKSEILFPPVEEK